MSIKHFAISLLLFMTANLACAKLTPEQLDLLIEQVKTDPNAIAQVRALVESGDPRAENAFGMFNSEAIGMPQNYPEALQWFQKAADHGYAAAMSNLANMYYYGKGTKQDDAEAIRWFRKAADLGHSGGMHGLGNMYYDGQGVTQNYQQAAYWWRNAAESGLAQSQNNLAGMYFLGKGMPKDNEKASEWFLKAANQNLTEAQLGLGTLYANGLGVKQSTVIAYAIYLVVAAKDKLIAQFYISQVTTKMSAEEMNSAKKLSKELMRRGQFQHVLETYLASQNKVSQNKVSQNK